MSMENDKPYKIYKSKEYGTLYITHGDNMLYYKKTPYEGNQWVRFRYAEGDRLFNVSTCIGFLWFIRDLSEEDLFLELL